MPNMFRVLVALGLLSLMANTASPLATVALKPPPFGPIEGTSQYAGNPAQGWDQLINEPIDHCGVPLRVVREQFGSVPEAHRLPGRRGHNAELPYYLTAATSRFGIEVAAPNCLGCHAGWLDGKLTVGLGDNGVDFTEPVELYSAASVLLSTSWAEVQEWNRYHERVQALAPHIRLDTVGVTPADDIAVVLFAHRDPETFDWLDEPRFPLAGGPVPLDVPALWHLRKKTALYYTGAGRGAHGTLMVTATSFCADSEEEISRVETAYRDVRSYFASIEPPAWPGDVDPVLAETGREVFEENCASCHGTYGHRESYPNRLVSLADVGTDSLLATRSSVAGAAFVRSYNQSYFGQTSHLRPGLGYVAPPLDGVWATAPYFHNGSVPTLEAVLAPRDRPERWVRQPGRDETAVGVNYRAAREGETGSRVYDTGRVGYRRTGHRMGAYLSIEQRSAVLEYLKTL